ncbi:hypothetical protein F511_04087 [Dorcoceras hygrometricum]|uniref:Uncharacterized protein n=1 Tax=Dorcoceras hygrometricum TaxID=472368 RepID=A0A2Z7CKY5_9LAMI|nr:hypothetical protein F511_04087 [Dorcoceras hygrometricum]
MYYRHLTEVGEEYFTGNLKMWRRVGANSNGNGVFSMMIRYFSSSSRKRAPNLRKINPRVPVQEAASIAEGLHQIIKTNGPLTVSNTWNHAKDAGISGLSSKTHMKLLLKWMRGRSMLKLTCNGMGSNKRFFLSSLPEEPHQTQPSSSVEQKPKSGKPSKLNKKQAN